MMMMSVVLYGDPIYASNYIQPQSLHPYYIQSQSLRPYYYVQFQSLCLRSFVCSRFTFFRSYFLTSRNAP